MDDYSQGKYKPYEYSVLIIFLICLGMNLLELYTICFDYSPNIQIHLILLYTYRLSWYIAQHRFSLGQLGIYIPQGNELLFTEESLCTLSLGTLNDIQEDYQLLCPVKFTTTNKGFEY